MSRRAPFNQSPNWIGQSLCSTAESVVLKEGDLMVGRHFVKQTVEDSRDASSVRVSLAFFPYLQFLSISSIPNL